MESLYEKQIGKGIRRRLMCLCFTVSTASALAVSASCSQEQLKAWDAEKQKWDTKWEETWKPVGPTELWTIECVVYETADHYDRAETAAEGLRVTNRLRPEWAKAWHESDRSRVLYGAYSLPYGKPARRGKSGGRKTAPSRSGGEKTVVQFSEELERDLDYVRTLEAEGAFPFLLARAAPMPTQDVGPPEWDLNFAKGTYTLNVGVTYPDPGVLGQDEYKQAAVEWVRALRDEGHEAYFYHDPNRQRSSICVGTFGPDALVSLDTGNSGYFEDGNWVELNRRKYRYSEAVEKLRRISDFQYNLENGRKVFRRVPGDGREVERRANESFLVKLPRAEADRAPGKMDRDLSSRDVR